MNRRGFIGSILALSAAPAIVHIANIMPIRSRVVLPTTEEIGMILSGNRLLTIEAITTEALKILQRNLEFTRIVNHGYDPHTDATHVRVAIKLMNRIL